MNLSELLGIAWSSVRVNRLRSALTTLGVVIGVSAVVILVGLGDGMKSGFNAQFGALSNKIVVTKLQGSVAGGGQAHDLKDSDAAALISPGKAPDIAAVTTAVAETDLLYYQQQQFRVTLTGARQDYLDMANRTLAVGSFFTREQATNKSRVVILGPVLINNIFGGNPEAAIGKTVRIGRSSFKVIGVLNSNGQDDSSAIMPIGTARAYLVGGADKVDEIIVMARSTNAVGAAQDQLTSILDQRHSVHDISKRDFDVKALKQVLDQANQFLQVLGLFTIVVASISLVVGGIGIANIMLVSVTERTREIGIRKAIGAPRRAIMRQFLIESTVLAGLGGLAGILTGLGVLSVCIKVLPSVAPKFGVPDIPIPAIVVAFGVSLAIGLIAGGYPARRASRLAPIEALRFE